MELAVFSNAIEHDNSVVYREPDEGEQRGDNVETHFNLEDREETEGNQYIVKHSDHSRGAVCPLKPERYVNQDAHESGKSNRDGFVAKLSAGDRPNRVSPDNLV